MPHTKRILNAFFQTIRVRIPAIASSALIAHLPRELKRLYMTDWDHRFSIKFDYSEFIDALYDARGMEHLRLFDTKAQAEMTVMSIFAVLKKHQTDTQYNAMISLMPLLLRVNLVTDYAFEGHSYFLN